jgi:CRP-like cAMP-binding protein
MSHAKGDLQKEDSMTPLDLLQKAHFASKLSASVLMKLAAIARVVEWNEGTLIFREGDPHEDFYVLSSGHVALEMNVPSRGLSRILTVRSGELLAWSALLGDGRMTASAIAMEPTQAIAISGRKLRELCQSDHEVGYQVMGQVASALSQRLLATRLQLLDLFAKPH